MCGKTIFTQSIHCLHLQIAAFLHPIKPKKTYLKGGINFLMQVYISVGRRGVVLRRHLSVGAFARARKLASLLCAKRASGARSGIIHLAQHSYNLIFGVQCLRLRYFKLSPHTQFFCRKTTNTYNVLKFFTPMQ